MNRTEMIATLQDIAARMAQKYGYTEMQVGEDRQKGIWGEEFTKYLEKHHGECTKEIRWHKPGNYSDFVEFRFRFSNPVVSIRFHEDGRETLASLEFTDHRYVASKKGDPLNFVEIPCELQGVILWNPRVSRPYATEMEDLWDKADSEKEHSLR